MKEEEPTFKAGDEVEYYCIAEEKYLPAIYAFNIEGTNWLYTDGNKKDGFNMRCAWSFPDNVLRKPDPDKAYREIAKEIMVKRNVPIDTPESVQLMFNYAMVNEMLIEAIKKRKRTLTR